jgi:hypothetical protein
MNWTRRIASITVLLALSSPLAFAQPSATPNEHEAHHPAAQAQSSEGAGPQGMGMMGEQGMVGGKEMMKMPMTTCCPCAMMGGGMIEMGMMKGGGKDSGMAAKMMQMHAEMMKANAAIMEKYAKEIGAQK